MKICAGIFVREAHFLLIFLGRRPLSDTNTEVIFLRDEDIHVGDVLRVRSWEDMADEFRVVTASFGRTSFIDISGFIFAESMRYMCHSTFTIDRIEYDDFGRSLYRSCERIEYVERVHHFWNITANMLEPYPFNTSEDEDFTPLPILELMDYLKS